MDNESSRYKIVCKIIQEHIDKYYKDIFIESYYGFVYDRWCNPSNGRCVVYVDKSCEVFYITDKFRKRKLLANQLRLLDLKEFAAWKKKH